ncbi:hypothetical protein [uncultured Alistipes sp.]|nr:hypothetical protein [uncultured Alistipes sp.]
MFQRHRATPSFTHGMTNTFCIGDFDFSFLIQGAGRHDFQWRPLLH